MRTSAAERHCVRGNVLLLLVAGSRLAAPAAVVSMATSQFCDDDDDDSASLAIAGRRDARPSFESDRACADRTKSFNENGVHEGGAGADGATSPASG